MRYHLFKWLGVSVAIVAFTGMAYALTIMASKYPKANGRYINCGMAEFHPDFTQRMRDECRAIRSHRML